MGTLSNAGWHKPKAHPWGVSRPRLAKNTGSREMGRYSAGISRLVRGPAYYYRECNLGERGSLERSSGDQIAFRGV